MIKIIHITIIAISLLFANQVNAQCPSPPTFTVPADIQIFTDSTCIYDASVAVTGDVTDELDCGGTLQACIEAVPTVQECLVANPTFPPPACIIKFNIGVANCQAAGITATYVDAVSMNDPCTGSAVITRTWSLVDGNGNAAADQVQTITVTDNIAPIADLVALADVTGACSVAMPTAPTATDNCGGAITGTTTTVFPITTPGTTVVTWIYTDCAGNTATQTQTVILTNATAPVTDTQIACDTYTWLQNGMTYTATGMYNDTILNAAGCDSVITLDLTINQSTAATVTVIECDTYTWAQNGMTYTSTGMYNHTIPNTVGCDSVITLDLTINQSTVATVTVIECDTYTWAQNGMTYTSTGMYDHTIPNTIGCDSVVTLDLTINQSTAATVTVIECDTYTWAQNGMTYTSTGMYDHTIPNTVGCDSVITLDLTINTVNVAVTDTSPTLTANATGATYQWLDCSNGFAIIAGETAQTFTSTVHGDYAVEVTQNACVDTSACTTILITGIAEHALFNDVSVYPNPNQGLVNIALGTLEDVSIQVFNIAGRLIYQQEGINTKDFQFELNEGPGVYLIELNAQGEQQHYKLVKE